MLMVLLAMIPALGLLFYTAEQQRRSASVEAQQDALRLARLVSANQRKLIEGVHQLLTVLAQVPSVRGGHPTSCGSFLTDLLGQYPLYANIGVADRNGEIVCSAIPLKARVNAADRAWFQRAVQTSGFAAGEYQVGRITGKAAINFGYPVLKPGGEVAAVVFAALDLVWFNDLAAKSHLPPGATITVMDRRRTILARYPDSEKWIGQTMPAGSLFDAVVAQSGEGTTEAAALDGLPRLYGFASLGDGMAEASVLVGIPKDLAFAPANRILARGLAWLLFVSALALAGAWWIGDWLVVRKVNRLIKATERLAAGDLGARVGSPDDKGELHQLACAFDQMAEALQMEKSDVQRANEKIERNLEGVRALREIALAITSSLDLHSVLNVLLDKIDLFLPYAVATIRLLNTETGYLEPVACRNINEDQWKVETGSSADLHRVLPHNNAPVMVLNAQRDSRSLSSEFLRKHDLVSFLRVPIIAKGETLGVLTFFTREEHEFSKDEVEFLTLLAGQAAIAIHNAQLYERSKTQTLKLQKANEDLKRKDEVDELLKELSQDITFLDIDSLLRKLTVKVREFLKVDLADVRSFEGERWYLRGVSGANPKTTPIFRPGTGRRRTRWILENRKPLVITDILQSEGVQTDGTTERRGIRGFLGVPMFSREGEIIGILRALTYQPREFIQKEVDLLQQMANGAAVALENARLLEHIKNQAVELEKANKVKDEFLGFVSHELKTPVNVVIGYASLLHNKTFGEINSEQKKALEKVVANTRDLLNMINTLLEVTKIRAGAAQIEIGKVNLNELFEELRSVYDVSLDKDLVLVWDFPCDLPVVNTDSDKLKHILQNLINNAIKYTDRGSITLSARHLPSSNSVEFKITDTGIGIPAKALPFIFEMFRQVEGSEIRSSGGVGLGLHIVKKLTELLRGEIGAESEVGKGSKFTLRLPLDFSGPDSSLNDMIPPFGVDAHNLPTV